VFRTAAVARRPRAYWGAYAASLAAVECLAATLADELNANTRIRVHTLESDLVRTRLRAQAYPAEDRSKLLAPEETSGAWLYLMGTNCKSGAWRFPATRADLVSGDYETTGR
jgi:NAD(P)-dependent dehydrogenase (short-subunit alcohol dehydrogenase family)